MKTVYAGIFLLMAFLSHNACGEPPAPAVAKGETFEQVIQKLGAPKGQVAGGRRTTFYYDRGTVDFLTGRVERAYLISPQEAKEKIVAREKSEADMRAKAEADRTRLISDGKAQLEKTLADKTFAASPPAVRLAYWDDFQKKYPLTDVSLPIADAKKTLETVQGDNDRVKELQALNVRAAEIDSRFKQLDEDYAASLANWKRTEIDQERAKLTEELIGLKARLMELLK